MKDMKTQGSVLKRRTTSFLILFGFLADCSPASAHPLLEYWQNRTGSHAGLILEPRGGYYSTSNNFNESSNSTPVVNTNTRMLFDLNASYGLNDDWFLFGRLSLLSMKTERPLLGDSSAFGLADQLLGLAWRIASTEGGSSFSLQFDARIPAYKNRGASVYAGDGSKDLTMGGFAEIPIPFVPLTDFYLEAGLGYTYRTDGFSSAVPWSFIIKRDPAYRGFGFEAGLMGQVSMKNDAATNNSAAAASASLDRLTGSGGSMLIDGINPSWFAIRGRLSYKLNGGPSIYTEASTPISGTSIPSGLLLSAGASIDFGETGEEPIGSMDAPKKNESKPARNKIEGRIQSVLRDEFNSYDLEAKVLSVNDRLNLVKIDQGSTQSVEKGQYFDIFQGEKPLARAKVTHVKDEEAALTVIEYYQDHWIETGSTARRLLR